MEGLSQLPQGVPAQGGAPQQGGAEDEAKRAQEEQMRRDLLATVLDSAARERCMSCLGTRYRIRMLTEINWMK
jgi:programmed cell death protein 5